MPDSTLTRRFKEEARRLGFDQIGIARAEFMDPEARRLEQWLNAGSHGKMTYMERHFDKRVDPTLLVPGAKSVISLSYNYYTEARQTDKDAPQISKYAHGKDYHHVLKRKLRTLFTFLEDHVGKVSGRCFVDSAPVLERDWARRSGLGWIGKNTMLIQKNQGSYFFLAELIVDVVMDYDQPIGDYCGTCRKCIDACPTEAISSDGYVMDGSKCISYLTIELKEAIPDEFAGKMENWAFGCDICQEVCPWNRFAQEHQEPEFVPHPDLLEMEKKDWEEITEEVFRRIFKGSAVKRTKFAGLQRNLRFLNRHLESRGTFE